MNYGDLVRPGTEVKLKNKYGGHYGVIKAVWVAGDVTYQVCYMHNGDIKEPYVPRIMFDVLDGDPIPAGFQLPKPK